MLSTNPEFKKFVTSFLCAANRDHHDFLAWNGEYCYTCTADNVPERGAIDRYVPLYDTEKCLHYLRKMWGNGWS